MGSAKFHGRSTRETSRTLIEPEKPKEEEKNPTEKPTQPVGFPQFPDRVYHKPLPKKSGRQRAKDRNSADDGTRQLFELWWEQGKGLSFPTFFRGQLSEYMRFYYPREYINAETRNPKSWAEHKQWKRERESRKAAPARSTRSQIRAIKRA